MTHYLVLGAGRQGVAAVHDLITHGEATTLTWIDSHAASLEAGLRRITQLTGFKGLRGQRVDADDRRALQPLFTEANVCFNALPYRLSLSMTQLALEGRTHYVDLGGNTEIVKEQFELQRTHPAGEELVVLPDCGLMPGMGNVFVAYALAELGDCAKVEVRCGGLPADPKPPLGYKLTFSVAGLTNEYFGRAQVLRGGEVREVDTFTELEQLDVPGVGECEAFITSGGLSTTPWTFQGRIDTLDYKTIRYRGHHEKFKTLLDLGLLGEDPIALGSQNVVPRQLLHMLLEERLQFPEDHDLVVLTCDAESKKGNGRIKLSVLDRQCEETGFTAMERCTSYSAAACAHAIASGAVEPGPKPLESAIDPKDFVEALNTRGIEVEVSRE